MVGAEGPEYLAWLTSTLYATHVLMGANTYR